MTVTMQSPIAWGRERRSSVFMALLLKKSGRWPVRELAPAPEGSGLTPVPGSAGMPLLGHTLDYIRFGSDFTRSRFSQFGEVSRMGAIGTKMVVASGRTGCHSGCANDQGKGVLPGRVDVSHRRVLPSWTDADEFRWNMQEAFTRDRLAGYVAQLGPTLE